MGTATRGRPRSAETDQAIVDAALSLLVEEGYGGMSMEGVAARAKVGKAAIYRRWSSKAELLVDALRRYAGGNVPLPDTGDLRADLLAMLEGSQAAMAGRDGAVMQAFAAEKARYPELRDHFEATFVAERRAHLEHLCRRAMAAGTLPPDTDVGIFVLAGPAILAHHLLMHHHPVEPDMPARIVDFLLARPAPAPPLRPMGAAPVSTPTYSAAALVADLTEAPEGERLRLVIEFVDRWSETAPEGRPLLVAADPGSVGDPRWDALVGGLVEHVCWHGSLTTPEWCADPSRFLDGRWWPVDLPVIRARSLAETPAAFERRGVMLLRCDLDRV